ncbi:MAG: excinuclease ABC subunit UvrC [Gammaproteobacteria bacterium]|nr:excinuclease ABC subunit UvrC [Gammaproteobacteria bacterium]
MHPKVKKRVIINEPAGYIDEILLATDQTFDGKAFVKRLGNTPGVYRMLDVAGKVLYVGKARDLKKRVGSYFNRSGLTPKTRVLITHTCNMEVTVTHTENEALILENNLIKEYQPRYNVLFRDDKSYPYIFMSTKHSYPRLTFHRGGRSKEGRYFGPYPGVGAVRETLNLLQKVFQVRQCEDSFFSNRSRPCLQYQIKRCTAPCVGHISQSNYAQSVKHTMMFLEGKSQQVTEQLAMRMEQASHRLDFEGAARYRDQISSLRHIQERQHVDIDQRDIDVVTSAIKSGVASVQLIFFRDGRHLGDKTFFPKVPGDANAAEVLSAFLPQYYLGRAIPSELILGHEIEDKELLSDAFAEHAGHKVHLATNVRGERRRLLDMANVNIEQALNRRLSSRGAMRQRLESLKEVFNLDELPSRMECFDISHTMGEATVASCVVFDQEGARKSDYRRFNIEGITGGDDYAAMNQAIQRRYKKLRQGDGKIPDILFIDGGKGQLHEAQKVLEELQISDVMLIGIAKGPERKAGAETLFVGGDETPIELPSDSSALHLIQQIRDEAHRFAITGHRARRAKTRRTSPLEGVEGIGPKRRRALLQHFGGIQGIERAGVEDLSSVSGISHDLAKRLYSLFHPDNY